MLKISTKGRYAVEALLYIATCANGETVNIKQINEHTDISEKYLEQIFFLLRKAEVLETVRGPRGGYRIRPETAKLTVGQVLRAVEGDIVPVTCVAQPDSCTSSVKDTCMTRSLWVEIAGVIDTVVDSITIEMLKNGFLSGKNI